VKARTVNLILDGHERVGEHIRRRIKERRGTWSVAVRRYGAVAFHRPDEVPANDEPNLVGTYTSRTPPEVIEDDLIAHAKELSEAA
jgi:hypothetical protein